jgi:hypothetical protein
MKSSDFTTYLIVYPLKLAVMAEHYQIKWKNKPTTYLVGGVSMCPLIGNGNANLLHLRDHS